MRQVLFTIPPGIPIYGYGAMLFLAFVGCIWLAKRLGKREGIHPDVFSDLALWLFLFGILGARLTFVIEEWKNFRSIWQIVAIWDGGLVFYGSIFGAIVGYFIGERFIQRKHPYDRWKILDVIAPCVALGLCLGRLGCLLNGCCYGNLINIECEACSHVLTFPLAGAPRYALVDRGYQTTAGFTVERDMQRRVEFVEPESEAKKAGLRVGDMILKVNDADVIQIEKGNEYFNRLHESFRGLWPRGKNDLTLVVRGADERVREVGPFAPRTLPLHPTQLYETISMALMLFFLVSYYPYKTRDGILMFLLMAGYGVHRFLNELLRTDNELVAFNMTLSQNISILVLICAAILGMVIWRRARNAGEADCTHHAPRDDSLQRP